MSGLLPYRRRRSGRLILRPSAESGRGGIGGAEKFKKFMEIALGAARQMNAVPHSFAAFPIPQDL
jgi:hypothetical protein